MTTRSLPPSGAAPQNAPRRAPHPAPHRALRWFAVAVPLLVFAALAFMLARGLQQGRNDELPSPLVGRALPAFELPVLRAEAGAQRLSSLPVAASFAPRQLLGQVWLLNVWASWCTTCREEHPVLMRLSRESAVPLVGFDYQDHPEAGLDWLARMGDPYRLTVTDLQGRAGLDLGVVGVPETFVIDKQGRVRHKLSGPLTDEVWRSTLHPLIKELQGA